MAHYDVLRHQRGGWQVRRVGASRASSRHATFAEAHAVATRHAQRTLGAVIVHDEPPSDAAVTEAAGAGPGAVSLPARVAARTPPPVVRSPTTVATSSRRRTTYARAALGLLVLGAVTAGGLRRTHQA
jgi:Uncharacterized protein conserved in bacteria (DUF2188)